MKELKILYLGNSSRDAEVIKRVLSEFGPAFSFRFVDTKDDLPLSLTAFQPDLILSDLSMTQFDSFEAMKIFREQNLDISIIKISRAVSEEFTANILKEGTGDCLKKDNLTRWLTAAVSALEKQHPETERQEHTDDIINNERMMKEAERLAGIGSWQADLLNGKSRWSDEAFRIYGYEPGEIEPNYENFLSHVHPGDMPALKDSIDKAIMNTNSFAAEFRIIDKNGKIKFINSKIRIECNGDGKPIRLIGFNQNITERRKVEQRLLKSIKDLAELEKELVEQKLKQQVAITEATMNAREKEREELGRELHDNINQVLASVKMFLNTAKESEELRGKMIQTSYENIEYVIEEIRKLSKTLVQPSLDNTGLVEALYNLTEEINTTNGLQVYLDGGSYAAGCVAKKKELAIYRIVQEQMNNIVKYAKAGKVVIELRTGSKDIFLSVLDDGMGFDPAQKVKGIGLKNIKSRVDFYSGKMNIISSHGKGCTLEILIPI